MSAQELRIEIIKDNLPKLIKQLTGFKHDEENSRRCEQFAWSIIRNHRNLSTNSHEVRRKIDGMQEKFRVDNYGEHAQFLGRLCDEIIEHPLCQEHYEMDVHWSLLDFLLSLAYNPTGALRRNEYEIDLNRLTELENINENLNSEKEYWKNTLKENNIPTSPLGSSESDLSEWSDEALEGNSISLSDLSAKEEEEDEQLNKNKPVNLPNIKPPQKEEPFRLYDGGNAKERLLNTVQHSWWLPSINPWPAPVESERIEANFALAYNRFLNERSNNLLHFVAPSLAVEACLIREILWMFHSPQKCKFFSVSSTTSIIKMRDNVTIPSVAVNGLGRFMEQNFIPYIYMMNTLQKFFKNIYFSEELVPAKTIECYAANLRLLLSPIWKALLDYEQRMLVPRAFQINTVIQLLQELRCSFQTLECLYCVHEQCVLNLQLFPAHISSVYLLASLMQCFSDANNAQEANLAMSLFLTTVRVYCELVDTWWTEGRLDDWQREFLVECNADQSICVRPIRKDKSQSFFVPTNVSKVIESNCFYHLLLTFSLEAGRTLNLLFEINRIGDLRNACDKIEGKLYDVFLEEVLKYVNTLQSTSDEPAEEMPAASPRNDSGCFANDTVDAACDTRSLEPVPLTPSEELRQHLTTTDKHLLLAFLPDEPPSKCIDKCDGSEVMQQKEVDVLNIFEQLQSTKLIMPMEEVVLSTLSRILKIRIAFANSFVLQLYREEFDILKHLRNIRKVLLLEASDLMHQFYSKLFKQIESADPWANPFALTMQLNDILCSKFPDLSSLFRLEITSVFSSLTDKVFEAVDVINITYNLSPELTHIISANDMQEYNKIFRFLLKVKWGICTLENLRFPRCLKRRIPYAPFEMIDLLIRRIEQLRFWMMYALQNIHFHLMTHVLQSMGQQLEAKIEKCCNLKEIEMVHKSYISTVCEHCFLEESLSAIKLGVEQLLNLVYILRLEWHCCSRYVEYNRDPLAADLNDSESEEADSDYVANQQISAIELTYIRCHQYLANKLNNEVYLKQKTFLSGLSAAFNTSLPY